MKIKYWLIITAVLIIAVGIFTLYKYIFREADSSVVSLESTATLTSSELLSSYETDEVNANSLYLDKVISVKGKVDKVSEDSAGYSVYLKEPDDLAGIICSFDKTSEGISAVHPGDTILVKGICNGYLLDVVLNKCILIN